jgi:LytS/YehU family sensor histidine kinase
MVLIYFYFILTNQFLPFERFEGNNTRPLPLSGRGGFRGTRLIIQNLFLSLGVYFVSTLNFIGQQARKRREDAIKGKKEQLENEMKLLRSQINPHFMFNALNNIYALAIQKNDRTPEAIMKLSLMMRYVLYEANVERVPVVKEWEYIDNYIDVQLLKFEKEVNITRVSQIDSGSTIIAPMLLLPFVENAFKHSNLEADETALIEISLTLTGNQLVFNVKNSLPGINIINDSVGGIGLENVKRRLKYIYPKNHSLEIIRESGLFSVALKITLH